MSDVRQSIERFCACARTLSGGDKSEAQVFCDRLFQAFGHTGYKEAGATLEGRVTNKDKKTWFADLLWKPRLLLRLKKRGAPLAQHTTEALEDWLHLVPDSPKYVVLCNVDELWIYHFNAQLDEPMDRVRLDDLPARYAALNFLFPDEKRPLFNNDRRKVTGAAARKIAEVFRALVDRGEPRERAQRFTLQCVVALFAEDVDLLPRGLFTGIVEECRRGERSSDLIGALFRQMSAPERAGGARFKGVPHISSGLFDVAPPIDLTPRELHLLGQATGETWSKINLTIFGTLFQASMTKEVRHRRGAHNTHEADIQRVVLPTLVRPFRERIAAANTLKELRALRDHLVSFKVLDPACGSGNFLYVAYRELKRLELELLQKIHARSSDETRRRVGASTLVSTRQLYGIDIEPFAVELAKVTLMLGKQLALDEARRRFDAEGMNLPLDVDASLPLDNLDENIRQGDALFGPWPKVDAIVGNPPFQSKNKMQEELGPDYVRRLRAAYPDVPGRADYCVYWFRRAHDELHERGRAGLVGTNTIRQNYSREGGLDYIVRHGGTIYEAVSTQVWPGDAVVHVSIVNWTKGDVPGKKKLFTQLGHGAGGPWTLDEVDGIPATLVAGADVTHAAPLLANARSQVCYQGQTHGQEGFLLTPEEAAAMRRDPASRAVIHPYLTGDDLVGRPGGQPSRYLIDLNHCEDVLAASQHGAAYARLRDHVRPDIEDRARVERAMLGPSSGPRQRHAQRWWRHWRGRGELIGRLSTLPRYIACSRVTKRPIVDFVAGSIRPSDVVMAFLLADDYSFGILQSAVHWAWFRARCSTMKGDSRYTSNTVFNSFVWPEAPTIRQVRAVAESAVNLRALRRRLLSEPTRSLRQLYATLDGSGRHPLKEAHAALDSAVWAAYGMTAREDVLAFLLARNQDLAAREARGEAIVGPGLPPCVDDPAQFLTEDCVRACQPKD